jgi:hypothetical protein
MSNEVIHIQFIHREVFDCLCGEYIGGDESARELELYMKAYKKSVMQVLMDYFALLKGNTQRLQRLDGLPGALHNMIPFSKQVRDFVKSYEWEHWVLFEPFNKLNWPYGELHKALENQMHKIVENVRLFEKRGRLDHIPY